MVFHCINFVILAFLGLVNSVSKSIPRTPRRGLIVVAVVLIIINVINLLFARGAGHVFLWYWGYILRITWYLLLLQFVVYIKWHPALSRNERWIYIITGLFFVVPVEILFWSRWILCRWGLNAAFCDFTAVFGFNIPSWIAIGYGILAVILGIAAARK